MCANTIITGQEQPHSHHPFGAFYAFTRPKNKKLANDKCPKKKMSALWGKFDLKILLFLEA